MSKRDQNFPRRGSAKMFCRRNTFLNWRNLNIKYAHAIYMTLFYGICFRGKKRGTILKKKVINFL